MNKLPDWRYHLEEAFFEARKTPFEWGSHDCATFSSKCIGRATGEAFEARVKSRYQWKNKREALKLLRKKTLMEMASDIMGPSSPVNECMGGDLILVKNNGHLLLGIHDGHGVVCAGDKGLVKLELEDAVCGWRIR